MQRLAMLSDTTYALLRIMAGWMWAFHGAQILTGYLLPMQPARWSQHWFGGIVELACGLLITVGWRTRAAAFVASGQMAVAYFQFHWKFRFGPEIFPAVNQGEMAVLYCFVFLYVATRGGVKWCLEAADRPI